MQGKQTLITFASKLVIGLKIGHWTRSWSLDSKLASGLKMVIGCETGYWTQN